METASHGRREPRDCPGGVPCEERRMGGSRGGCYSDCGQGMCGPPYLATITFLVSVNPGASILQK